LLRKQRKTLEVYFFAAPGTHAGMMLVQEMCRHCILLEGRGHAHWPDSGFAPYLESASASGSILVCLQGTCYLLKSDEEPTLTYCRCQ